MYSAVLEELLGPRRAPDEELSQRHRDIARSAQVVYEDAFFHLLHALHARYGCDGLVVAGGCGQNSVANGKIYERSPFARAFVPPSPPDAGGAIGAAAYVWHRLHGGERKPIGTSAFLGPAFEAEQIAEVLNAQALALEEGGARVTKTSGSDELCRHVAEAIAAGRVVGWFQGRMEWGPRALGNRSIVCDPRRADMKQILNEKI